MATQELPISTSQPPEFTPEQVRLFHEVLTLFNARGVPYVISGAEALRQHTGICRNTKDLDVFIPIEQVDAALQALRDDGFETEVTDPVWLAKAHRGEYFVDLITGMSNGVIIVDQSWIERGHTSRIYEVDVKILAPEELIASKLFVTRRERFDGADIAHVIYGTRGKMAWERIMQLIGEHWEMLLWMLVLFAYVYPAHTDYVPRRIWDDLTARLQDRVRNADPKAPFRGSLIDPLMFAIDVKEWGLEDVSDEYRQRRLQSAPKIPEKAA